MRTGRIIFATLHLYQISINIVANVVRVDRRPVLLDLFRNEVVNDLHVLLEQFQSEQITRKLSQHPNF